MYFGNKKQGKMPNPPDCRSYYVGFSDKSSGGRKPKIYNLDMILSVGYHVNSKRGIAFRRWANSVLKKYVIQGYTINEKRLQALERTVDIQTKMLLDQC